jgi:type I restriction enzyme M protein
LIETYDYLLRQHSSDAGRGTKVVDGEEVTTYSGDLLEAAPPASRHRHVPRF